MISSKERASLRKIANTIDPEVIIGQNGITENLLLQIETSLDAHEMVKIAILQNCDIDPKKTINELAKVLNAEPVQAIGRKMVLYRFSRKAKKHIEF